MRLKITALASAIIMFFNVGAFAAFSDVDTSSSVGNAVVQLSELGIINGFGDGTFHPDEILTRGQFAKIAVYMLGKQQEALSRSTNTVFGDVTSSHWASGFVNYIAEKDIINGYPDGTFGVEDTINYAQALTILVRLLGYNGDDVSYRWPDGYISKAQALGITKNMTFDTYENVTRGNAAYIIYNTLIADKKEGSQLQLLSSTNIEDVVIYGDWKIDASIANGNILTTKGTYKLADSSNISSSVYGRIGTLYLDAEERATAFVPEEEIVREITVVSAAQSSDSGKVEVTFTENGNTKTESFGANAPLYYEGNSSALDKGIAELEAGREAVLFFTESGVFKRMYLKESTLLGPVTITSGYSQVYSSFDIVNSGTLSVVRDGRSSSLESISLYDVVYYMSSNNTLYAYTDKASGTYEKAYPLKANVTSVVVAGREYPLSTQAAINKMNESASAFALGDRVTLLFGRSGEVVDVVDMSSSGSLDLAVLTDSYNELSDDIETEGQRMYYVTLATSDGNESTYETDKDYSDYIGNVVRVTYSGDIAKLSLVSHNSIYGEFDSSIPSLDGHWLTNGCVILELVKNKEGEKATVKRIEVRDIPTTNLIKSQVIHAQTTGDMQDINFLYVKDVTKSDAQFGVVTQSNGNNRYTILVGNEKVTVTTARSVSNGSAVEIVETADGQNVTTLTKVGSGSSVSGYSSGRIRVGGQTYAVSDYVKIYGGTQASEFQSMSIQEILSSDNVDTVTLYSDRSLSSGGVVRVIAVKTKK